MPKACVTIPELETLHAIAGYLGAPTVETWMTSKQLSWEGRDFIVLWPICDSLGALSLVRLLAGIPELCSQHVYTHSIYTAT